MSSRTKDKKGNQQTARNLHHENRNAAKTRRQTAPEFEWNAPTRKEKERFLIVCEGQNTEPGYFNQFRISSATILSVGTGFDTIRVVERAELELADKGPFDQIWVVFDKDGFPAHNFDNAIFKANSLGFQVAHSNQAFEYWLILHFEDHQGGPMPREDYHDKINGYLAPFNLVFDGKSSKKIGPAFFNLLFETDPKSGKKRVDLAIERAERVFNQFDHRSPASEESSTTVFRLVREILKFV